MNTEKTENPNPPKPRGYRLWLTRLALLLGLPLLFYYGYCWGVWGRGSLLLQYLFQCSCPLASEEARYPEYVDVIVPACKNRGARLSPSGRFLYVRATESTSDTAYLLDFETNEKTLLNLEGIGFFFLTDDLLFVIVRNSEDEYLFDRMTGETYPIQRFSSSYPGSYVDGYADPDKLATALKAAKQVFLINDYNTLVALSPNFPSSPEFNFHINGFSIPGDTPTSVRLEQFLQKNDIVYENIPFYIRKEVISPDGKLVARTDGIYLVETGQKVVESVSSSLRRVWMVGGWTHDDSAVVYIYFIDPCVLEISFLDPICIFKVPQPVLKLKVPEEYLLP